VAGPDEARQLQASASAGRPQHDDLAAGAGDADDGVCELALHEHPALDLKAQPDERDRCPVEVRDGDADVVEASYVGHGRTSGVVDLALHPSRPRVRLPGRSRRE
jgi:hypothetical protein